MMATTHIGSTYNDAVTELIQEQNELQFIIMDLPIVSESNPEMLIKYADFIARIKEEKR